MIDIPSNLISAIGEVNRACTLRNKGWHIDKEPNQNYYIARVGSQGVIKKQYIDDLLETIIEIASKPGDEKHVIGFD